MFEGDPSNSKVPVGGSYWHQNGWTGTLFAGRYTIIPQAFNAGDESKFQVQVVSKMADFSLGTLTGMEEADVEDVDSTSTWSE